MDDMGRGHLRPHGAPLPGPEWGEGALLLAMTRSQARALRALCPEAKVELFPRRRGGAGPLRRGMEAYERTARVLEEGAQAIARRLQGA